MSQDTPGLVTAAKDGQLSKVKKLVEEGHHVDSRDKSGATALYWACCRGHDKISQYLIEAGCDINAQVKWGTTALMGVADNGYLACAKQLLSRGVDVDVSNGRGDTALHIAAYRGHVEILKLLVHAEADPFVKNSQSMTAIQEAFTQGHKLCVRLLTLYMETFGSPKATSLPINKSDTSEVPSISEEAFISWPSHASSPNPPYDSGYRNWGPELGQFQASEKRKGTAVNQQNDNIVSPSDNWSKWSAAVDGPSDPSLKSPPRKVTNQTQAPNPSLPFDSQFHSGITEKAFSDSGIAGGRQPLSFDTQVHLPSLKSDQTNVSLLYNNIEDGMSFGNADVIREDAPQSEARPKLEPLTAPALPPRPMVYRRHGTHLYAPETQSATTRSLPFQENTTSALHRPEPFVETVGNRVPSKSKQLGRAKHADKEIISGLIVGEFAEQVQIQMAGLQTKLQGYEILTRRLRDQIESLEQENVSLRIENSNLQKFVPPQQTRHLRTRGRGEGTRSTSDRVSFPMHTKTGAERLQEFENTSPAVRWYTSLVDNTESLHTRGPADRTYTSELQAPAPPVSYYSLPANVHVGKEGKCAEGRGFTEETSGSVHRAEHFIANTRTESDLECKISNLQEQVPYMSPPTHFNTGVDNNQRANETITSSDGTN